MTERIAEKYTGTKLAEGLSYEPAILTAAEWIINGKSLDDYNLYYDELVEYINSTYGIGRDVVNEALNIAERRIAPEVF